MPIEDRILEAGAVLTARYKKQDRTCEIAQTDNGLRFRLDDGTEHKSPSSAGKAVTGGACNGWVFWSLAGEEKPKREPKAKAENPAKAKEPAKAAAAKKEEERQEAEGGEDGERRFVRVRRVRRDVQDAEGGGRARDDAHRVATDSRDSAHSRPHTGPAVVSSAHSPARLRRAQTRAARASLPTRRLTAHDG